MYNHQLDPEMFDRLMPWERDVYISMLTKKIEEENEKIRQRLAENRVKSSGRR